MTTIPNRAPFGSSVARFRRITGHPNLDPKGLSIVKPAACDPCLYNPKELCKIFPITTSGVNKDPWRYKKELEEWAKNLGYRNQKILKERSWFGSLLGPAWYDIPEYREMIGACRNVGFGRTPRIRASKNYVPGPGTYYNAHPYKVPYGSHSTRPTLEREEPCRFKDLTPNWSLAPDRYKIIDRDSIEEKPKKIVSLRGPYDLFTGKRDNTSIKNHFNKVRVSAATWPLKLEGSFERYKKTHLGEMNKTGRNRPYRGRLAVVDITMSYKKPSDPGAAHYNTDKPKVFKQYANGFNSSYDRPPGYQRCVVWPGVGRYRIKSVMCGLPGNGHKHVFLSKEQRTIGAVIQEPMNSF